MTQIAGDGGLLTRPVARTNIPLHPAERVDVVIDFSAYGPGEELVLYNLDAEATAGTTPIIRFDVEGGRVSEEFRVPKRLRPAEPLPEVATEPVDQDEVRNGHRRAQAVMQGYTGDQCTECHNFTMVRNGTCLKCDTCGSTTGCS